MAVERLVIDKQYPGNEAVDVLDRAMDLLRVARLAINAFEADPSNVSKDEMASIAYVMIYAMDVLQPLREHLNKEARRINSRHRSEIWPGCYVAELFHW
jgi:hypothetical protein